jgi:hypothetical protein
MRFRGYRGEATWGPGGGKYVTAGPVPSRPAMTAAIAVAGPVPSRPTMISAIAAKEGPLSRGYRQAC